MEGSPFESTVPRGAASPYKTNIEFNCSSLKFFTAIFLLIGSKNWDSTVAINSPLLSQTCLKVETLT